MSEILNWLDWLDWLNGLAIADFKKKYTEDKT